MRKILHGFFASLLTIICIVPFTFSQTVSFSGDWENGITGAGNWKYLQSMAADRFLRVTSPVRQGQYAARVEVRPGDDPINSSGERAEVLVMSDAAGTAMYEAEASGTQFYAFSVRLDTSWQAPAADADGAWAIIFQLHGPDVLAASPSVAVSVQDRFSVDLNSGDLDSAGKSLRWKSYPLSSSGLDLGHWVDLVLQTKFAKDFTGSVTAWRRDEGQADFSQVLALVNVPTLQYKSSLGGVGNHYWKHGFYRSKQTTITNILWLDGLTRGDSYGAVVNAAFAGTMAARPFPHPYTVAYGENIGCRIQMMNLLGQRMGDKRYAKQANGDGNALQSSGCYLIAGQSASNRIIGKIFQVR
ncbi:MAG TPA: polysaccharide lyase [Chitinivibrionales bacterium]|nr:polysaccharide lyase [Chitinivibrionales bacterium]